MVGRYIKCLKHTGYDRSLIPGDYLQIMRDCLEGGNMLVNYKNCTNQLFSKSRLTNELQAFELMPENWTPNTPSSNLAENIYIW